MNHIGMDSHITTLEFAVVNEAGRLVKADRVATSVKGFMEFVRTVPRPRTIYIIWKKACWLPGHWKLACALERSL